MMNEQVEMCVTRVDVNMIHMLIKVVSGGVPVFFVNRVLPVHRTAWTWMGHLTTQSASHMLMYPLSLLFQHLVKYTWSAKTTGTASCLFQYMVPQYYIQQMFSPALWHKHVCNSKSPSPTWRHRIKKTHKWAFMANITSQEHKNHRQWQIERQILSCPLFRGRTLDRCCILGKLELQEHFLPALSN